jgi:hypothetical protein
LQITKGTPGRIADMIEKKSLRVNEVTFSFTTSIDYYSSPIFIVGDLFGFGRSRRDVEHGLSKRRRGYSRQAAIN